MTFPLRRLALAATMLARIGAAQAQAQAQAIEIASLVALGCSTDATAARQADAMLYAAATVARLCA